MIRVVSERYFKTGIGLANFVCVRFCNIFFEIRFEWIRQRVIEDRKVKSSYNEFYAVADEAEKPRRRVIELI